MNKWIRLSLATIIVATFISLSGCTSNKQILKEATGPFIQFTHQGIENSDIEISKINQQLYNAEEKLLKMEQVLAPALKWVEYQKTVNRRPGSWNIQVTQEGLAQLKNDLYQVTALELLSIFSSTGTQLSFTIKVTDLNTRSVYDWKVLQDDLLFWKNSFDQKRKEKLQQRALSISTLENVLQSMPSWNITEINDNTFTISSPSLGWKDRLTGGTWTYYRDKQTLEPADINAETLKNILLAN